MDKNKKVQIRLYPHSDIYKLVQYRIEPTELNWFQRIFCNCWTPIYRFCYNGGEPDIEYDFIPVLDKPGSIDFYKNKFKTIRDIEKFEEFQLKQYETTLKIYNKNVNNIEY